MSTVQRRCASAYAKVETDGTTKAFKAQVTAEELQELRSELDQARQAWEKVDADTLETLKSMLARE